MIYSARVQDGVAEAARRERISQKPVTNTDKPAATSPSRSHGGRRVDGSRPVTSTAV
jgi:hypothetical protein